MKKIYQYTFIFSVLCFSSSCNEDRSGETVESAYLLSIPEQLKYSFSRNGGSSVDIFACDFINTLIDYIHSRFLVRANIINEYSDKTLTQYFYQGINSNGVNINDEIATSKHSANNRAKIKNDVLEIINISKKISGFGKKDYVSIRTRPAERGITGYIGTNYSDVNLAFADERGLISAQVFKTMLLGAVQLDKIINIHLSNDILDNEKIRKDHQDLVLISGQNYTELEHNWDLAYGYYQRLRPIVQSESVGILRECDTKIFNAFVQGRYEMKLFRYDEIKKYQKIIIEELSKVIVVKSMRLLLDKNTTANINEQTKFAFPFLSEAYGYIYNLQFIKNKDGNDYFSYEKVKNLQASLLQEDGFWEEERLLSDENTVGSLLNIATEIGKPIGITPNDIKN